MRRAAGMLIVGLAVAGCGGARLDARDHETLKASLRQMMEGMGAAEKDALGKDVLLIVATEAKKYEARPGGANGGRPPGVPALQGLSAAQVRELARTIRQDTARRARANPQGH